jgi:hypothetical protein
MEAFTSSLNSLRRVLEINAHNNFCIYTHVCDAHQDVYHLLAEHFLFVTILWKMKVTKLCFYAFISSALMN